MAARTILLVEDNPDDRALAEAAFARLGFAHRLTTAEDGEEALRKSRNADLMLLDLKLPGADGFDVLRRLRADPLGRTLPVVVLTSSVEERDVAESYRLGANSYIRKPTDFDEFVPVLRSVVHYWLHLNQSTPRTAPP